MHCGCIRCGAAVLLMCKLVLRPGLGQPVWEPHVSTRCSYMRTMDVDWDSVRLHLHNSNVHHKEALESRHSGRLNGAPQLWQQPNAPHQLCKMCSPLILLIFRQRSTVFDSSWDSPENSAAASASLPFISSWMSPPLENSVSSCSSTLRRHL